MLALMAAEIGPGAEVIVPAFSFFSTASSVVRLGARVVFADIDFQTFQIDPDDIRRKITPSTRAVIVTHLFGDCADMLRIQAIAADHDSGTADRLRLLRAHGLENEHEHNVLGINSRLDSLQAAAISVRLPYVGEWNERRRQIAQQYSERLEGMVTLPTPSPHNEAVYNQFVIRTSERDALKENLSGHGIGTGIYYSIPLHLQRGLGAVCGSPGDFPRAEETARTCLALPIYPELEETEIDYVIEKIRDFFK